MRSVSELGVSRSTPTFNSCAEEEVTKENEEEEPGRCEENQEKVLS